MSSTRKAILTEQVNAAKNVLSILESSKTSTSSLITFINGSMYVDSKLRHAAVNLFATYTATVIDVKEHIETLQEQIAKENTPSGTDRFDTSSK